MYSCETSILCEKGACRAHHSDRGSEANPFYTNSHIFTVCSIDQAHTVDNAGAVLGAAYGRLARHFLHDALENLCAGCETERKLLRCIILSLSKQTVAAQS